MSIRVKIFIFLFLTAFVFSAAFFIFSKILDRENKEIMQMYRNEQNDITLAIIQSNKNVINQITSDYAEWNELADIINTKNDSWFELNIAGAVRSNEISTIHVFDKNRSLVFFEKDSMVKTNYIDIPVKTFDLLDKKKKMSFYYMSEAGLVIFSASIIHRPNSDVIEGYLFTSELIDKDLISYMELVSGTLIKLMPPKTFDETKLSRTEIATVYTFYDMYDKPVVDCIFTHEFTLLKNTEGLLDAAKIYIIASSVIFLIIFLMLFYVIVNKPLKKISISLAVGNNNKIKYLLNNKDEFGQISRLIDKFFLQKNELSDNYQKLQKIEEELKKSETEVRRMLDIEKDINQVKGQFVSMIAHEFRTPITAISSDIQLLGQYYDKLDYEKKVEIYRRAKNSIYQMVSILEHVSMANKENYGKLIFDPTEADIQQYFNKEIEDFKSIYSSAHNIIVKYQLEVESVYLDKNLNHFIIFNLLSNAVKYSDKEKDITVDIFTEGDSKLFICVTDQGIGIAENDIFNLFVPYHRGSNSINYKGVGLGMSIVKRCVDEQFGEIEIESKLNIGTKIKVMIPIDFDK
jgi:signal transduction histidine kinase